MPDSEAPSRDERPRAMSHTDSPRVIRRFPRSAKVKGALSDADERPGDRGAEEKAAREAEQAESQAARAAEEELARAARVEEERAATLQAARALKVENTRAEEKEKARAKAAARQRAETAIRARTAERRMDSTASRWDSSDEDVRGQEDRENEQGRARRTESSEESEISEASEDDPPPRPAGGARNAASTRETRRESGRPETRGRQSDSTSRGRTREAQSRSTPSGTRNTASNSRSPSQARVPDSRSNSHYQTQAKLADSRLTSRSTSNSDRRPHRRPSSCSDCSNTCSWFPCCGLSKWRGWVWLRRHSLYFIAVTIIALMIGLAATGPITKVWFCEANDTKLGATGYCHGSDCSTKFRPYNDSSVPTTFWPGTQVLSGLLLAVGFVGILSLTAGLYFILQMWHRSGTGGECHNCIRSSCYCCNDSGRSRNGKGDDYDAPEDKKIQKKYCLTKAKWDELDLGARIGYRARYRVKKIFIGIMDAIGVFVLVVGVLLIQWVDSANGEEDIGYQMLTGLMVLVPIWFLTRLVFRGVPGRIQDMVKNDVERAVKPVKTVVGQGARRVGQQAQEGMQNARRTAQQRLPTQSGARRV